MRLTRGTIRLLALGALTAAATLNAASAVAADRVSKSEVEARYQRERAACNDGRSSQDRTTCLREAAAARAAARQGQLGDATGTYEKNAMARCQALPAADRGACERRMRGEGVTSGSVAGGGIYRELVIPDVPAQGGSLSDSGGSGISSGDSPPNGVAR